jgi:UDP-hydrolysing UDP-N-acetyl-D-glucosamine 2-epimerase
MGEPDETIFITGCPSIDLAREVAKDSGFMNNNYFYSKYSGPGDKVDIDEPFVIVLQHPVTTESDEAFQQMQETLTAVDEKKIPAIIFWPNADAGTDMASKAIRMFREHNKSQNFYFLKNVAPEDFLALLIKSRCIIGNSSAAIREGSFLGVPAVNIGTRQDGRERGKNVIDVSYSKKEIIEALERQLCRNKPFASETLYGDGTAGAKIARILSETTPKIEKRFVE